MVLYADNGIINIAELFSMYLNTAGILFERGQVNIQSTKFSGAGLDFYQRNVQVSILFTQAGLRRKVNRSKGAKNFSRKRRETFFTDKISLKPRKIFTGA